MSMYYVIVNPSSRSGRGLKIWKQVEPIFMQHNTEYEVHYTKGDDMNGPMVREICDKAAERGEEARIVIMGGDGTVNEILQGIPSLRDVIVSVIPTGSSNDLARDLDLSTDPCEAVRHMLEQPTSLYIDLGTVHYENTLVRNGAMSIPDRRFIVSTGIGYDAGVCEEAMHSSLKNFLNKLHLGKLTYVSVALKQLIATKPITAELILDGKENDVIQLDRLLFVAGMNHRYEGGGFMFAPEANNHDGLIDLCVVTKLSKPMVLRVLPSAYEGKHYEYEGVNHYTARTYSVRTSAPIWVHTDGEVKTRADYISVSLEKEAIHLIY